MAFRIPNNSDEKNTPTLEVLEPIKETVKEPIKEKEIVEPTSKTTPEGFEVIKPTKEEKPTEFTDDQILGYFNKKNKTEFKTLEDYQNSFVKEKEVEKIVEKEVNPYADLIDDTDKAYYKFKKETGGRSRAEFDALNEDFSAKSALELARDRVREDTGLKLSDQKADDYLEKKLGIDLSEDEIDTNDEIELSAYSKPYRDSKIEQQKKYLEPLKKSQLAKEDTKVEMVELEDGTKMPKAEYEKKLNENKTFLKNITEASDRVKASDFKMVIDDNGEKRELNFSYEYSKEDKHSMLSDTSDVDATISKLYRKDGTFDYAKFQEGIWWMNPENKQKVISAAMQQARAEAIEEMAANNNNINFGKRSIQTTPKNEDGYGSLTGGADNNGFGVKFSFDKKAK